MRSRPFTLGLAVLALVYLPLVGTTAADASRGVDLKVAVLVFGGEGSVSGTAYDQILAAAG